MQYLAENKSPFKQIASSSSLQMFGKARYTSCVGADILE